MKHRLLAGTSIAVLCAALVPAAQSAVLTFDGAICTNPGGACSNGSNISQSYGDVAGQLDVVWDNDIAATAGAVPEFFWWSDAYSGLTNVGYAQGNRTGEIFLSPLPGFQVTLNSLNLGAWPNVTRDSQVTILSGAGSTLFSSGPISVLGSTPSTFTPNLTSADGLRIQFGPDAFNVGIDNIDFSVAPVPVPAAFWLLGSGMLGLSSLGRRRSTEAVVAEV